MRYATNLDLTPILETSLLWEESSERVIDALCYESRLDPNFGQLSNLPSNWDHNSNERGFEVIDEKGRPVFQYYYKSPYHIVFNGIFPFPGGLMLANENGTVINPRLPATFTLKRIFRYPSWEYPGKIDDVQSPVSMVINRVSTGFQNQ